MALAKPVSSSSVMKTKPLAVPGRWRTMTMPPTRARRPSGDARQVAGARRRRGGRARRAPARWGAGRSETPVPRKSAVSSSPSVISGSGARRPSGLWLASTRRNSEPERPSASTCHSACRRVPRFARAASAPISASVTSSAGLARDARLEVDQRRERRAARAGLDAPPDLLAHPRDVVETKTDGEGVARGAGSRSHSQPERVTSMGRISTPWRTASVTSVAG